MEFQDKVFLFFSIYSCKLSYIFFLGLLVPKAKGVIEFTSDIDHSFLEGLDEFSHCWLIWVFHIGHSESMKGKVRLPKLQGNRKGVFATRSPHRL
jgi:tRNA (adenine37-N6)-methyltransferase